MTHFADAVCKFVGSLILLTWHGLIGFTRLIGKYPLRMSAWLSGGLTLVKLITTHALHLKFIEWIWPALRGGHILKCLYGIQISHHFWGMALGVFWLVLLVLGSAVLRQRQKLRLDFESIGLTNGHGLTPVLSSKHRLNKFRQKLVFHANGVGMNRFETKKQDLEAILRIPIESIRNGKDPSVVEIITTLRRLREYVTLQTLMGEMHPPKESFFVGEAMHGVVTAKITELPHLLIAGATGGGKSVFFKQVLTSLLRSSPHLQVYLIDLKRGLEAKDFSKMPNVAIAKNIGEAVQMLHAIHHEMERRFEYLENKGYKTIDPRRDGMDRIVVAVDEASELYAEKSKFDDDYEQALDAQKITNAIAKLGRAAAIHLILATQKMQKETINTAIQENISARMCFKMNTLHGSLQVLGSKDALELPSIPGRGIWQHGTDQLVVQVPFANEKDIEAAFYQRGLNAAFEQAKSLQPMLMGRSAEMKQASTRKALLDLDA